MDIVNQIASSWFGISGGELLIIVGVIVVLIIAWTVVRSFLRVAFRIFALGCVTILGIAAALYVLFVIVK